MTYILMFFVGIAITCVGTDNAVFALSIGDGFTLLAGMILIFAGSCFLVGAALPVVDCWCDEVYGRITHAEDESV